MANETTQKKQKPADYNTHLYPIQINDNNVFKDIKTKDKISSEYETLYAVGHSLDIFGVYDGDIVLVQPLSIGDASKLLMKNLNDGPIAVFKIDNELVAYRLWTYMDFTTMQVERDKVTQIIQNKNFEVVRNDIRYTSNSRIMSEYCNSPGKDMYRGSIMTMLDGRNNWKFKRIDLQNIVGIIRYSFTPKQKIS